jgi:hypothetical protein
LVAVIQLAAANETFAKAKAKAQPAEKAAPAGPPLNACGCYRQDNGTCACTDKKGKCECPGECEPVGCDAKREKQLEREMADEVKRAQDDERKRKEAAEAEEAKEAREFQKANAPKEVGDAGEPADPATPSPDKPASKPPRKPGAGAGKTGNKTGK